ncbi:MAG: AAA family ATPase [Candidatus Nealsonbacteria bacterium]|nr:AAA family ATPase [Candidatus Nealsonbacteria bacterium]
MKNKVVCIVGMAGAGKTTVADEFVAQGFAYLRFGQVTIDEIKKRRLEVSEASERKIREELRKKYGMSAFALLNSVKIDRLLKESNVVVDGLYSWSEYKMLKERYGDSLFIVAAYAPPVLRYQRLVGRVAENDPKKRFRPLTEKEAKARDLADIESAEKGGPIAMADFTVLNLGAKEELIEQVRGVLSKIK